MKNLKSEHCQANTALANVSKIFTEAEMFKLATSDSVQ